MKIRHEYIKRGEKITPYIYIELEDDYEFGEDFFKGDGKNNFIPKLKEYVKKIIGSINNDSAVLIINGIIVGSMSLSAFLGLYNRKVSEDTSELLNASIKTEDIKEDSKKDLKKNEEIIEEDLLIKVEEKNEVKEENETKRATKSSSEDYVKNNDAKSENETPKVINQVSNVIEVKNDEDLSYISNQIEQVVEDEKEENEQVVQTEPQNIIKLNLNGNVINMELEEYIVGVVAAEMPASFNIEALKAQAVAARTYAMKKTSSGKVLSATTQDQAYKTVEQMKNTWGTSFDTYYNKVKSAVDSTKGIVMTYSGKYIDALYHSISSGKTEHPSYIWNSNYPYLVSVDSSLDKNVKNYEVSVFFTYEVLSQKLGISVNNDTNFEVLSYTVSDRVNEIKIGESVFTGVSVRTKLGLRSTDFTINKSENGVEIVTRGYGHGVGMSQYGANELAKIGYSYIQILNHYYTGIVISNI